jgi:hypothetical protein
VNLLLLIGLINWLGQIVKDSCVLSVVKDLLQDGSYFSHCLVHEGSLGGDLHEMRALWIKTTNEVLHQHLFRNTMRWSGVCHVHESFPRCSK